MYRYWLQGRVSFVESVLKYFSSKASRIFKFNWGGASNTFLLKLNTRSSFEFPALHKSMFLKTARVCRYFEKYIFFLGQSIKFDSYFSCRNIAWATQKIITSYLIWSSKCWLTIQRKESPWTRLFTIHSLTGFQDLTDLTSTDKI